MVYDLNRLRGQDREAQAKLWRAHWPEVVAICQRILGEQADASDVAVDVLTSFLFKYVAHLDRPEAIPTYLKLMAVRRATRVRDRRDRSVGAPTEALLEDDRGLSLDEQAELARCRPRLQHCLSQLTPKAASVLRLRFGSEMSQQAIGQLVGGSKQYIGKLIHRSIELLTACMAEKTPPGMES